MVKVKIAWFISLLATLGSLYFSEIRGYIPCDLCWYQRILMYPLPLLLGIAVYKEEKGFLSYMLPMSTMGMFVSLFHVLKQKVSLVGDIGVCNSGIPCTGEYINWFGFITIPVLAFIAFTAITILMAIVVKKS